MAVCIGVAFCALVLCSGIAAARLLGIRPWLSVIAVAPGAGLALLAVLSVWSTIVAPALRLAPWVLASCGFIGLAMAARAAPELWRALAARRYSRLAAALLSTSVLIPILVLWAAFSGAQVPLSAYDGAFHVEVIDSLRQGNQWQGWYPPGFHALAAAFLQLTPWVDSAQGALGVSLSLPILAPVAAFGFGRGLLGNSLMASAGAVLVSLTFEYPYYPHVWGGWPLATTLVIVLGLWTVADAYLRKPGLGWVLLGALLAASIALIHGTEVYTAVIGLAIVVGARRASPSAALGRDLTMALAVTLILCAPYLPSVLGWWGSGGAVGAAYSEQAHWLGIDTAAGATDFTTPWLNALGTGVVVDTPFRLLLVLVGACAAFRHRSGRALVVIGLAFLVVGLTFRFVPIPLIRTMYALTFPWGLDFRLASMFAVTTSLIAGVGLVTIVRSVARLKGWLEATHGAKSAALWRRACLVGNFTLVLLAVGSAWSLGNLLSLVSANYSTYSPDDAAAMRWLQQASHVGDVLANDGSADAGIWAPYKADVSILDPRTADPAPAQTEQLILDNITQLNSRPDALAAACALNVRYVLRGSAATAWEKRQFPALEELRQSPDLEEVFASGAAAVFRTRLPCGS